MKNVPNIGGIHLLSGHLHGCEGKGGEGREPPASRGDSSAGGWHVTAVTVLKGGWAGDLLRPLIQLRHTAPCQTQQLDSSHSEDSIDLLSGGPVALPYNPAPWNHHHHAPTYTRHPSCYPALLPTSLFKWLVKSGYGIQVGRERRRSMGLCAKYSHSWRGRACSILGAAVCPAPSPSATLTVLG